MTNFDDLVKQAKDVVEGSSRGKPERSKKPLDDGRQGILTVENADLSDQLAELAREAGRHSGLSDRAIHARPRSGSAKVVSESIRWEYRYAMLGLILGLSAIVGGVILGLNGVAGSTSWTARAFGLQSDVNDAAPGVVLFIIGLFMVVATRPKVKLKDLKG